MLFDLFRCTVKASLSELSILSHSAMLVVLLVTVFPVIIVVSSLAKLLTSLRLVIVKVPLLLRFKILTSSIVSIPFVKIRLLLQINTFFTLNLHQMSRFRLFCQLDLNWPFIKWALIVHTLDSPLSIFLMHKLNISKTSRVTSYMISYYLT